MNRNHYAQVFKTILDCAVDRSNDPDFVEILSLLYVAGEAGLKAGERISDGSG
jgi:hypothetical protein